ARSSRWEGENVPRANLFAAASVRPLTPMQLATSLRLATSDPESFSAKIKPEEVEKRLENLESSARDFAKLIEQPTNDFQIGVNEALLFSNNDQILKEFLGDGGDRLVGRLKQIKDPKMLIDAAVYALFTRPPTDDERKLLEGYLKDR